MRAEQPLPTNMMRSRGRIRPDVRLDVSCAATSLRLISRIVPRYSFKWTGDRITNPLRGIAADPIAAPGTSLQFELLDLDSRRADIADAARDAGFLPKEFPATEHPSAVRV